MAKKYSFANKNSKRSFQDSNEYLNDGEAKMSLDYDFLTIAFACVFYVDIK